MLTAGVPYNSNKCYCVLFSERFCRFLKMLFVVGVLRDVSPLYLPYSHRIAKSRMLTQDAKDEHPFQEITSTQA